MKHFLQVLTLASLALAFDHSARESKRQLSGRVRSTANEFKDDGCNDIIFVWARGSTEIGNMVCLILIRNVFLSYNETGNYCRS